MPASERKLRYASRLTTLLDEYPCVILANADFVGSAHLQAIRKELRALDSVLLMGKNTLVRKALRNHAANNKDVESLIPYVKGNVGMVFCKGNLVEVRKVLLNNRVGAPAKPGVIAPCSVTVPAGNTGLEPTQTGFMQALNIQTKISRGQIEILKPIQLITEGEKVSTSASAMLQKLAIKPFTYGLEVGMVYDNGSMYDSAMLDLTDDDIVARFCQGVATIRAVSLGVAYPTAAAVPAYILAAYKNLMCIALATDYSFEQIAKLKEIADNPELAAQLAAQAAASSGGGGGGGGGGGDSAAAAAAPAEESEEEEEEAAFGLFD